MTPAACTAVAMVLEDTSSVAAEVCDQLHALGFATQRFQHSGQLVEEVLVRPTPLIVMRLTFNGQASIALLRRLAAYRYRGKVLLLSGLESKLTRIAERLGRSLGLDMLTSINMPVRLSDLETRLKGIVSVPGQRIEPEIRLPFFHVDDLNLAFSRQELVLHYQPQFELATRRMTGAEALVRWNHPEFGVLLPEEFLPQFTRCQSRRLTRRVLQLAMKDAVSWREGGLALTLSVNVTPDDLQCPELEAFVCEGRRTAGGVPLVLEITETAAMEDELLSSEVAARLHLSGIDVALDDFGVGFSSMARLQLLPVSELKIDRSFIRHLHEDPQNAAIVESLALLGRRLGVRVVAEGVEAPSVLPLLQRFGCTHVQGFGLAQPMTVDDLIALARHKTPVGDEWLDKR